MPSLPELTWGTRPEKCGNETVLVSHCLEYGISVQGKTQEEIKARTERKLRSHILLSNHLKREPFSWLRPSYMEQAQHVPTTSVSAYLKEQAKKARRG